MSQSYPTLRGSSKTMWNIHSANTINGMYQYFLFSDDKFTFVECKSMDYSDARRFMLSYFLKYPKGRIYGMEPYDVTKCNKFYRSCNHGNVNLKEKHHLDIPKVVKTLQLIGM